MLRGGRIGTSQQAWTTGSHVLRSSASRTAAATASASAEPSTPTMITERVRCLVRSARSFAAMINPRDDSLQFHSGLRVVPNIMIIGRQLSGPDPARGG